LQAVWKSAIVPEIGQDYCPIEQPSERAEGTVRAAGPRRKTHRAGANAKRAGFQDMKPAGSRVEIHMRAPGRTALPVSKLHGS
jgi:hypothetical protein